MGSKIFLLPVIGATTFFILLFTFTKIFGPIPFSVNSLVTTKSTTFDVTGKGKVNATPDMALITVGIQANGQTVKQAQDQINSAINKVSDGVKKLGVDSKDIQTTNYNINPSYDFTKGQKVTGYSANTNLQIKVRKLDLANPVIDTATENGANQVGGVSFEVADKSKLENEAREKAIANAKSKAENAAKIAGFRLGKIINYSENFGNPPQPIPFRALAVEKQDVATQLETGTSEVTVTVTLSYELL